MASRKPYIKVVDIKDKNNGKTVLTLDMNQAGKEVILHAGIEKALADYVVANTGKMSLWQKIQICWSILK
jgi:hypothetical protein